MSFIDKILDKMSLNSEDDEEFDNEDYYLDDEEEEELEKIRLSAPGQVCTQTIDVTREDAPFSLEQLITKMGGMGLPATTIRE